MKMKKTFSCFILLSFIFFVSAKNEPLNTNISPNLLPFNGNISLTKHFKKNRDVMTFFFDSKNYNNAKIFVIPKKQGNIRINQIFYPNNESDGPFGQNLNLDLTQKGIYQLKIGESLMNGEPFLGEFELKIELN